MIRGDWQYRSEKCDTSKIARVENARVENAGADRRGKNAGVNPMDILTM